jgi:hypothetical protein
MGVRGLGVGGWVWCVVCGCVGCGWVCVGGGGGGSLGPHSAGACEARQAHLREAERLCHPLEVVPRAGVGRCHVDIAARWRVEGE